MIDCSMSVSSSQWKGVQTGRALCIHADAGVKGQRSCERNRLKPSGPASACRASHSSAGDAERRAGRGGQVRAQQTAFLAGDAVASYPPLSTSDEETRDGAGTGAAWDADGSVRLHAGVREAVRGCA